MKGGALQTLAILFIGLLNMFFEHKYVSKIGWSIWLLLNPPLVIDFIILELNLLPEIVIEAEVVASPNAFLAVQV